MDMKRSSVPRDRATGSMDMSHGGTAGAAPPTSSGKSDWGVRTKWTLLLLGVLVAVAYFAQPAVYIASMIIIVNAYREVMRVLNYTPQSAPAYDLAPPATHSVKNGWKGLPSLILPWYFLVIAFIFTYIFTLRPVIERSWPPDQHPVVDAVLQWYQLAMYCLWCAGFMALVMTLRRKTMTAQLLQFAWMWLTLGWFFFFGSFFCRNANFGMLWLVLPFISINANDIFAYIWGRLFGRTPLIPKLSPKKTLEGFVGALFSTVAFAALVAHTCADIPSMQCAFEGFGLPLNCPDPAQDGTYVRSIAVPVPLFGPIMIAPVVLHSVPIALFASLVAPFAGFFASAVKRTIGIKDFGSLIPGHGGMTDRMDCQLLMGLFAWLYYTNFVRPTGGICGQMGVNVWCVGRLALHDQIRMYNALHEAMAANPQVALANGIARLAA
eukprot:TRINITY_DN12218_c0_g1_i1.p1 TRINITY_DN12218_c0_g1~~TRINITY_DN12218_c0_g1_i1.p1  ORF type:complete len:437 (-),score=75.84 TRINITY_DN12218_c0_g1_i1:647-1957(-)